MKKVISCLLLIGLIVAFVPTEALASVPSSKKTTSSTESVPVKEAVRDFKHLRRSERKAKIREVKKAIRNFKAEKKSGRASDDQTVLLVILSILLPPLAVYLKEDEINSKFWIDLILTLIFWIPGVIYALLVVFDEV